MKRITLNGQTYENPLLVFALEMEAQEAFLGFDTLYTGVGKINAAYQLTKALQRERYGMVINLGTAGSTEFNRGEVVCCSEFIQRDMDATALGFGKFETPFSGKPPLLEYGLHLEGPPSGICGSGDQFEMEHLNPEYNVIEMEAYALASVCKEEGVPFLCLKYISDGADGNAVDDWQLEVKKAAQALKAALLK